MSALLAIGGHGTIGLPSAVSALLTEALYCFAASSAFATSSA